MFNKMSIKMIEALREHVKEQSQQSNEPIIISDCDVDFS